MRNKPTPIYAFLGVKAKVGFSYQYVVANLEKRNEYRKITTD